MGGDEIPKVRAAIETYLNRRCGVDGWRAVLSAFEDTRRDFFEWAQQRGNFPARAEEACEASGREKAWRKDVGLLACGWWRSRSFRRRGARGVQGAGGGIFVRERRGCFTMRKWCCQALDVGQ